MNTKDILEPSHKIPKNSSDKTRFELGFTGKFITTYFDILTTYVYIE
jgi:hypothetical protein